MQSQFRLCGDVLRAKANTSLLNAIHMFRSRKYMVRAKQKHYCGETTIVVKEQTVQRNPEGKQQRPILAS